VGGVGTPTTGLDDNRDPDGEKIEQGIEGGEDGRTHAPNFKWASYVVQIVLPMLLAVVVVCFPPWMRVTIRDRHSFGREEEDEDDDGDCSRKRNDYKTMTATNDCSGRGRRNTEGRWNQNIIAIGWRWRLHRGTSRRLPPPPVVGRHHSREEEGCGSETLSSCGDVDNNDDSASDDGRF
jgi:hypothetical protein